MQRKNIDYFNSLSIHLLEKLGNKAPNQHQINIIESLLRKASASSKKKRTSSKVCYELTNVLTVKALSKISSKMAYKLQIEFQLIQQYIYEINKILQSKIDPFICQNIIPFNDPIYLKIKELNKVVKCL